MNKLYELAAGHTARFPDGDQPFQITTRLLEECGEVASEVNHFERSGIKVQKHGEPSRQHMAGEIKQCMLVLIQLAQYYTRLYCKIKDFAMLGNLLPSGGYAAEAAVHTVLAKPMALQPPLAALQITELFAIEGSI